ncbi:alpha/beta hydrolase [Mycolicibacterium sp. 120270]|uniref:alpha/beta hydrolase n=1 Tax=Mycolicibacterium sp. 120270 TaxID=3090600 RepID=UPI00299E4B81|nr:alpha/beta hydrolase [Mycolicibacterium sp. 120270]MDX1886661.1 alpha/beta hydrolase [Mycolicibacterium sp. 120270]
MSRPTVTQAEAWNPDSLRHTADNWDAAAADLRSRVDAVVGAIDRSRDFWSGSAAEAARGRGATIAADGALACRCLITAAVAARDGAVQMTSARAVLVDVLSIARADGFAVAYDGTVTGRGAASVLVQLTGGEAQVTTDVLTARVTTALDELDAADEDAARDITEALTPAQAPKAQTSPSGAWPVPLGDVVAGWSVIGQDRIAAQIDAMTPEQRQRLIDDFPEQVGNTDGVPWPMRIAANRVNIAQAIADERRDGGPEAQRRIAFYQDLLAEVDDPTRSGRRVDRQILAFDPQRSSLIELNGDLATAKSVAVMVPGMNTTIESSAANTTTARRFVSATRGEVAAITYLGGAFPRGDNVIAGVADAADPRYALDMAPRLVAFSEDVDRTVDAIGRDIPVTYIGHSYGGSILGTAEVFGLTADRTLYLAAAGAGVGVDDPTDWHNRNPDVLRFSMTAPGDLIEVVQGNPGSPHGADPDEMPGVIRLSAGDYDDGRPMAGPRAHTDIVNAPSDSWRNILAVITGDSRTLHKAG